VGTVKLQSASTPSEILTPSFLVTPFWSDNDISKGFGQVSYEVHSFQSDAMAWVSTFISQQQQVDFTGSWMLIAEWKNVPQYLGPSTKVNHNFTIVYV